jgi:hypothetical protein
LLYEEVLCRSIVIETMRELGMDRKTDYTFPLTDTIGKTYYSSLNRRLPD